MEAIDISIASNLSMRRTFTVILGSTIGGRYAGGANTLSALNQLIHVVGMACYVKKQFCK
jgi:hypothetical protein